jgi:hypothetical protein
MKSTSSALLLVLLACSSTTAAAQSRAEIGIYHGTGNSRTVTYQIGSEALRTSSQTQLPLVLSTGDEVCISVPNAHTLLYSYDVKVDVDTTSPSPPNFGGVLAALQGLLPTPTKTGAATPGEPFQASDTVSQHIVEVINSYNANIKTLQNSLARTRTYIIQSAPAEEYDVQSMVVRNDGIRGLRALKQRLDTMQTIGWVYNNPNLGEEIKSFRDSQRAVFGSSVPPPAEELIQRLHSYAMTLLGQRDFVRSALSKAQPVWRNCQTLHQGQSTIRLITRAVQDSAISTPDSRTARDTGVLSSVIARTAYPRSVVEIAPVAFARYTALKRGYALQDGKIITVEPDQWEYRLGTVLSFTPHQFQLGKEGEAGFGFGIGLGFLGEEKPVSEFFFVPIQFVYRDWVRLGAGWGWSETRAGLKPGLQVGQAVPGTINGTDDLFETKPRQSWFLFLSLRGLSLK